ncbi:MAG: STAS domain-containing protein [Clostridia bacterium]|nr:STAS domain-containing protein [Clostridia bacterium]
MRIDAERRDNVLYLRLNGEMDEYTAGIARRDVDRLAETYATVSERAVFDLSGLSFMDSTGIGFLIGRYKKFKRYGVPVYVTNPSVGTDRILEMSGVYTLIPKA